MFEELSHLTRLAIGLLLAIFLPRLMERIRLPGVLGYILAGVILGPCVTGVLTPGGPVLEVWAELGKLLFMFFVGFEIDIDEFKKVRNKAALFGGLTFLFPFAAGYFVGYMLGYSWVASMLIGSIIASHTLLAHPILAKLGLLERESVLIAVGGTIFTDVASMLILAVAVSIFQFGFSWQFLLTELVELAIYVPLVLFGLSKLARRWIVHYGETPEARVCILLVMLAVAAELAQLIQLEGIVGAFLVGLAIKRTLRGKFAVEQLEVLAKALFIPTFFLTTGFLLDFPLLGKTLTTQPQLAIGLLVSLVLGKWLGAFMIGKICNYSKLDVRLIFSITLPQMAATLASAVVGYSTMNAEGERMFDLEFVNGVLVLVVATCVAGPILSKRWGRMIAEEIKQEEAAEKKAEPEPAEAPVPPE
ncbi:cation:proton antiporter [Blastopirellula sp. JC732]|uniref:Cation:proton antiporter n=1 Tax=Blastopirellula sediminis TaxID=2894196 RepID=A0A9X1MKA1_9BACT|nr:cation:proton antiporter [Blastopirellula sediminis]MCC9607720.1 cation:proton antiporter [Blastopirellula sediminis]MCC9627487.1 cation:proton antiporter [Blastopirellula sediminis]